MKLQTKNQWYRDHLGLMIDYSDEELKQLHKIEVKDESIAYQISEWCVFKDTKQRIIGTWSEL